ncbi:hypothetical protein Tco_0450669 [Tanacetum coccineum]
MTTAMNCQVQSWFQKLFLQQTRQLHQDKSWNYYLSAENNTSGPIPQCLVLHQMTSDHNRSELGIHDHSNEQSSSKLVPNSCSLSNQDSYITTRVGITIPPSYSNAEDNSHKVVRLGINPMIQPEPEDLPKDNPKLEIAVLRIKKKCMDKGSKERSPPHNLGRNRVDTYAVRITMLIADIEDDIMDPVMQCTTLPSHSGFSQKKLVSFVTEIHTTSIDFLTPS